MNRPQMAKFLSKPRRPREAEQGALSGPQPRAIESQSASPREEVSTWGFGAKGEPRQVSILLRSKFWKYHCLQT